MVMETIENIMALMGAAEIDSRLEEQLIDGILYAFQEQTQEVFKYFFWIRESFLSFPSLSNKTLAPNS